MTEYNLEKNKSLCLMPWIHLMVKPSGLVKPCCRFKVEEANDMGFNIQKNPPNEVLNSEQFSELREQMLAGKKIPACVNCYSEEAITGNSMRLHMSKKYGANRDVFDTTIKLRYLELTFGNYCNLACRTCNSYLSTSWYNDDAKLSQIPGLSRQAEEQRFNIDFIWKPDDFNSVEEIKFTGGEPMLHPNFIKLLDTILTGDNQNHITLDIYTNASWVPKQKLLSKLAQFKCVNINFSIDGVGPTNDYIRHNSKWDEVEKSVSAWLAFEKQHEKVSTVMCTTFNILNVHDIMNLIIWWTRIRNKVGVEYTSLTRAGDTILILLQDPDYLHLKHHPDLLGEIHNLSQFMASISNYNNEGEKIVIEKFIFRAIQIMTKYLNVEQNIEKFWLFNNALDKVRTQTLKEALPEVYDKLKQ
jgi:MoaA/NifB/PqqE/SkfB family radical SAM enzyme